MAYNHGPNGRTGKALCIGERLSRKGRTAWLSRELGKPLVWNETSTAHISNHLSEVKSMLDADYQALTCIAVVIAAGAYIFLWLWNNGRNE